MADSLGAIPGKTKSRLLNCRSRQRRCSLGGMYFNGKLPLLGNAYHGTVSGDWRAALVEIAPQLESHYESDKKQYEEA